MGEVERLKELLAQTGSHGWARTTEDDFDYDFSVPGNYSHIWVRTGPRDADRIAVGAGLFDDDVLDARVDLVLAAHNALPALLSQLEEMRERERKLVEACRLIDDALVPRRPDGSPYPGVRAPSDDEVEAFRALLSQTDEGERMEDTPS
jgi:hypothetical protein